MTTRGRISLDEFHRMRELGVYGKRAELIRGIVFEKPAVPPVHTKLPKRLYDQILGLRLPGCVVFHVREEGLEVAESLRRECLP